MSSRRRTESACACGVLALRATVGGRLAFSVLRTLLRSLTGIVFKPICRAAFGFCTACGCCSGPPAQTRPRATGGPRNRHPGMASLGTLHFRRTSCRRPPLANSNLVCSTGQRAPRDQDRNMGPHLGYYTWPLTWPLRQTRRRKAVPCQRPQHAAHPPQGQSPPGLRNQAQTNPHPHFPNPTKRLTEPSVPRSKNTPRPSSTCLPFRSYRP